MTPGQRHLAMQLLADLVVGYEVSKEHGADMNVIVVDGHGSIERRYPWRVVDAASDECWISVRNGVVSITQAGRDALRDVAAKGVANG